MGNDTTFHNIFTANIRWQILVVDKKNDIGGDSNTNQ